MSDAVKVLRKEIARSKIEEGTVVRFDRTLTTRWDEMSRRAFEVEDGKVLTYAAVFVMLRYRCDDIDLPRWAEKLLLDAEPPKGDEAWI